ncbi:MAG: hypothetical protein CM1200mP30_29110 [Pseudomonadota bacterium]|nr:MAG: hypothetical protein CM1200mP30_29110 [Pseudomonadota bacterium]
MELFHCFRAYPIYFQDSVNSAGLPQGFNVDNYTKSILGYVDKQCSRGINHFHIVKLPFGFKFFIKKGFRCTEIPCLLPAKSQRNLRSYCIR